MVEPGKGYTPKKKKSLDAVEGVGGGGPGAATRDVPCSLGSVPGRHPCMGVTDERFLQHESLVYGSPQPTRPTQLFERPFPKCSRPQWQCKCCFPNSSMPCLLSYHEWVAKHQDLSGLLEAAAATFRMYSFDSTSHTRLWQSTLVHSHGAFRPCWPTACQQWIDESHLLCSGCECLGGGLSTSGYMGTILEMDRHPPRSALVQKCNRINSGQQASCTQFAPQRGRRNHAMDTKKVDGQAMQEAGAQAEEQLCQLIDGQAQLSLEVEGARQRQQEQKEAHDKEMVGVVERHAAREAEKKEAHDKEMVGAAEHHAAREAEMAMKLDVAKMELDQALCDWTAEQQSWAEEREKLLQENADLKQKVHDLERAAATEDPKKLLDKVMEVIGQDGKMSKAQCIFFRALLQKCYRPRMKTNDLLQELAILALIDFGPQTYQTFRVFLGLPHHRTAIRLRAAHEDYIQYSFGDNPEAYKLATKRFKANVTLTTSDGTRIVRMVAMLRAAGLIGKMYPADIRKWPVTADPVPIMFEELKEYVGLLRQTPTLLAHSLVTVALQSVTDRSVGFLPIMLFPEPSKGFDGYRHQMLMMETAKRVWESGIHNIGDCTDSCASGPAAGIESMTPRLSKGSTIWLGLDMPEFQQFAPLLAVGEIDEGQTTEFWWSHYGDEPHATRFSRGNFGNERISLITGFNSDKTQQRAMLTEIKVVADELSTMCNGVGFTYTGGSLKDMYTMLPFRDQKGDAAKALLKQDTMECMVKVRGEKCFPLLLYIVMTFYWTEVFINPDFTRPYLVAHYLFTAKGILDMLESFVELHKLPKDIYLMSSASRRTINSMCHTGIHHPLKMYRKAEQMAYVLDKYWRRASLKAVNTKPMEGYHGSIRTDGNDFNKAPDEWCDSTSAMVMKRNILNRLMLNYGVEIGAPKNTIRENQGKTSSLAIDPVPDVLRGLVGTAGLVSTQDVTHGLPCSPNVVPEQYAIEITSYRQLHDTMKAGAQSGLLNALAVLEKLAVNLSNDLKSAAPNRFGKWKVFNRPVGMKLVMDDNIAAAPFEPTGADGVQKPDKVVRAEMAAMEGDGPASVDAPSSRVLASAGVETDQGRLKRLDEIINNNRESKKQLSEASTVVHWYSQNKAKMRNKLL